MIKELAELETPPTTLGDFMPPHKIVNKVDDLLYRRLEACLPDITPFLTEQPTLSTGLKGAVSQASSDNSQSITPEP